MQTMLEKPSLTKKYEALPSEEYVPRVMPALFGTFDMTALYVMSVFWISNVTAVATGGAAGFTYWILCVVLFFVPCAIVVAQLGVMFPHEGSIYNWTHRALGGFWSFFIGLCAWLPGVLSLVSAADVVVSCLQALNSNWLVPAWQQGLMIIGIIIFSGIVAVQRARMVQNITNVAVLLTFLAVLLMGVAAVVWLLKGHPSATNFRDPSGWQISWDAQTGNISLLGTVTLALLGATNSLNIVGEIKERRVITRHILWGSLLVLIGYLVTTFALLVVQGQNAAFNTTNPVSLVISTVDMVLGKGAGNVAAICVMMFFVIVTVVENCLFARLLFVAGVDRRLPIGLAQLNKNRVPANAIVFQTIVAALFTFVIFFVVPFFTFLGKPENLTSEVYVVTAAGLLIVWAFSFIFPFIDVAIVYFRDRQAFQRSRIFPMPILVISVICGPLVCILAMVDTLIYSWIPPLIGNGQWWYIVGALTLVCLILCATGSILANSEANWQEVNS
jgi:glutamate:GABA antiporter